MALAIAVGKDVEAVCRKCGEVWHVMVTVADGKITKVQCKQCSANHRYRPPEGEERVDASAKAPRKSTARKASPRKKTTRGKKKGKASAYDEPIVEPDLSRPIRLYEMSETYSPGDRVDHPKFGQGVVEMLPGDGKMNVFFETGRRVLAHAR